ncbi:MAG: pyridoxal-phosphate dependent enzyme, partial [Jiangellaceae bacterium]
MYSTATSWYSNPKARSWRTEPLTDDIIGFHETLPGYARTRLVEVPALAADLEVGRIFVKEESARLGLPAFKILGASYAVSRALSARLGTADVALGLADLKRRMATSSPVTLIAATDGNHGRAVAHVAGLLGLRARIFVPASLTQAAKDAVAGEGASVSELELSYDDVVAAAADAAAAAGPDALLIQDTSWPGYEQVTQWIVDGYSTLFQEADAQLAEHGLVRVDLVVVPVGVGSLAQAAVRHYRSTQAAAPVVLSVEPRNAPAIIASLHAGEATSVETTHTIMAGLNCGTPSAIAWPYLEAGLDAAVTVSEG